MASFVHWIFQSMFRYATSASGRDQDKVIKHRYNLILIRLTAVLKCIIMLFKTELSK